MSFQTDPANVRIVSVSCLVCSFIYVAVASLKCMDLFRNLSVHVAYALCYNYV